MSRAITAAYRLETGLRDLASRIARGFGWTPVAIPYPGYGSGGRVRVLGQDLQASAVSTVALEDGEVVVTAESFEVGNGTADRLLTRALRGRFDFSVPVGGLPYGLQVRSVQVTSQGIAAQAVAEDTVLTTR